MTNPRLATLETAVVYQIYPRSFNDSNGDGIGDIPGITAKLDYLSILGVDVLWLSPIFASPNDDNGYDISDYREVMPEFGTMADVEELIAQARQRGIRIMLDLVVNHTSDEHEWFRRSAASTSNPYRDYYMWRDPSGYSEDGTPLPPNNWISAFSPSAWEFDANTGQFYLHMFSAKQPDLNWENPAVRREVYDLMRFLLDKGVGGFRMDVINLISKPAALIDAPETINDPAVEAGSRESSLALSANGPRVHEFLQEMRREVLDEYDTITVGETPITTVEDGILYSGFDRGELDMIFTFEHVSLDHSQHGYGKWSDRRSSWSELMSTFEHWEKGLEQRGWNSLYWNNHDQPRAVSRFGDDSPQYRVRSACMLGTVLHMMCGTPYIYQGEELGMTNTLITDINACDDLEIHDAYQTYVGGGIIPHEEMMRFINAKGRDNARTPMQWDDSAHAGFTTGTPWLAVNPNYPEINAEAAVADPHSVYHHYRRLIALRREHAVIRHGRFELLARDSEEIVAYRRFTEQQQLIVVANTTATSRNCDYAAAGGEALRRLGVEGHSFSLISSTYDDDAGTTLRPYEAKVYLGSCR
ncbi:Oligo-1,6-glucosidase [Corynebacterium ciconiae DSM 44920]|uniref:glycoside hydrolase family 13 protein n=1 Tax=Corynebacterium ciconiae TaxID=227319 RepID=UPI0003769F3F|nr:alpha-glucosidase [Corynebacterium ciconiae]WKD61207.1 Oligo-1,6-glucosidase [Corynebacterium ciconiae DSM 44920]